MIEKIELTKEHLEVIEKYLKGEINQLTEGKDRSLLTEVIEAAEALYQETKEDFGDDLVKWYYDKYQAQENAEDDKA